MYGEVILTRMLSSPPKMLTVYMSMIMVITFHKTTSYAYLIVSYINK